MSRSQRRAGATPRSEDSAPCSNRSVLIARPESVSEGSLGWRAHREIGAEGRKEEGSCFCNRSNNAQLEAFCSKSCPPPPQTAPGVEREAFPEIGQKWIFCTLEVRLEGDGFTGPAAWRSTACWDSTRLWPITVFPTFPLLLAQGIRGTEVGQLEVCPPEHGVSHAKSKCCPETGFLSR